jgi:hypothetical protein
MRVSIMFGESWMIVLNADVFRLGKVMPASVGNTGVLMRLLN